MSLVTVVEVRLPFAVLTEVKVIAALQCSLTSPSIFLIVSGGGGFAHLAVATGWATLSPAATARVAGPNFYFRVLPIGVFMATSISLGNAAYLFLGVSRGQVS